MERDISERGQTRRNKAPLLTPRKRRTRSIWRYIFAYRRKPRPLERKLGIFGTRAGALTVIGWVIGIATTPWLRWFVSGSLLLGLVFATVFQYLHNREPVPPDIFKPED